MNQPVTILLATYNGEKYLSHQLDSIISQTYGNWHLLIRDDCSTDNTAAIIRQYQKTFADRILIVENTEGNGGSVRNFSKLLEAAAGASYIMFCDQDDEWKQDKVAITFSKILELEKQYGKDIPLMVFTNFQYVDETMHIIESKKNFEISSIKNFGFPHLLAQNPVYGCTTIINKALADKVNVIPQQAENHDYWIALVAAAFGKLYYLNEKTVLYRQHAGNISGSFDNDTFKKRIKRILLNKKNFRDARAKYAMLGIFKKRYYDTLDVSKRQILDNFLCFFDNKKPAYIINSIKANVRSRTITQSLLLYVTIFFLKNTSAIVKK